MGQQDCEENSDTLAENPDAGISMNLIEVGPEEEATKELAAKLSNGAPFNLRLTRDYKVEVISDALSRNWNAWDEGTRLRISGLLINVYKQKEEIPKGPAVAALRVRLASGILEVDPSNALRILASIAMHGVRPLKPGELNPQLCKAIQLHFLEGDIPRYEKLFVKDRAEETRVVARHIAAVITGPNADPRDTDLASKQLKLVWSILNKDLFGLLDEQTTGSIVSALKTWPISMLPDLAEVAEFYAASYPGAENPFKIVAPALAFDAPQRGPSDQKATATPERNLLDPVEVIAIVSDCFKKFESDLAKKGSEIGTLKQSLALIKADKIQQNELKEQKRFEDLRERVGELREEIRALEGTLRAKESIISALQEEKSRLELDIKSYVAKVAELENAHQQEARHLTQSIDSVSDHRLSELKRSIEIDLKSDFDELSHLPNDESCEFHMDALRTIFRKLRQKGICVGEGQL